MTLSRRHCLLLLPFAGVALTAARRSDRNTSYKGGAKREFTASAKREFTIDARKFTFSPSRLEVDEGDLVHITLVTHDIPHSFTIDDYRIAKRAEPGKPTTFEFLADRAGTFKFYCNLKIDDGCQKMSGDLIVRKRA